MEKLTINGIYLSLILNPTLEFMKNLLVAVFVFITLFNCSEKKSSLQKFSLENDSLVIRTQKQKGAGLFALGLGSIHFSDVDSIFS